MNNISARPQSCYMPSLSFILEQQFHNKPTTAIFNSGSSTSIILKEVISLAIVALSWRLLMQRRTEVEETPRHRKVRRPFAVRTQYILYDTQMIKIMRHSITSDTVWIRNVRRTPQVRDRHTKRIAVAYLAIKLRS